MFMDNAMSAHIGSCLHCDTARSGPVTKRLETSGIRGKCTIPGTAGTRFTCGSI